MIEKAEYPGELDERVMLPNRRSVRIRALHRGEHGPIYELDAHLSLRTRYDRFFLSRPALPESVIRQLACVDYRRQLALIAEYDGNSGREVVALASLAAIDDRRAEVGLVVCDEWQQQGVGTALANKMLQEAETRGFDRFAAHLLSGNLAIRRLLRKIGDVMSSKASGGVSEVTFTRRLPRAQQ